MSSLKRGRATDKVARHGVGMKALKSIAVLAIITVFLVLCSESMFSRAVFGQAAVPAPTAAPPVFSLPAAPGQPQPLPTVGALHALAPAPGSSTVAVATPAATSRVFVCSCSGYGYPVQWIGQVSSSSPLLASQAASGQCTSYKIGANATSPFIPKGSLTQPAVTGSVLAGPPGQVGTLQGTAHGSNVGTVAGITGAAQPLMNLEEAHISQACANCACD
jgi:hypothetical protein